ncbi:FG-GAP repeat domain-containing protein [Chitinimonas koreensis]|uniref:FG-GAP repeat domain-containing protein n=1 Tax=Chitinimonas koreensis TaxID=356302 RepID=UPI002240DE1F|nr:VCBS repeat-containing protein [Chitinimonas koreensis]
MRSYRFAYATSQTSSRSLLASVQPCDGAGNCLPATTFDWQSQQAINRAFNGGGSGRWTAGLPWIEQGTMTVDVDGDGRTDFLRKSCPDGDCNNANWDVALSRGNQFERKTVPAVGYDGGQAYSLLFSDFNGDGRVDIGRRKVFLNGPPTMAGILPWPVPMAATRCSSGRLRPRRSIRSSPPISTGMGAPTTPNSSSRKTRPARATIRTTASRP